MDESRDDTQTRCAPQWICCRGEELDVAYGLAVLFLVLFVVLSIKSP